MVDDAYNYDGYDYDGGAVERPENTILPVYEREEDYGDGGQAVDYDYNDNYNNNYDDNGYDDNYNEPDEQYNYYNTPAPNYYETPAPPATNYN